MADATFQDAFDWLADRQGQTVVVKVDADDPTTSEVSDFVVLRLHTTLGHVRTTVDRQTARGVLRIPIAEADRSRIEIDEATCSTSFSGYTRRRAEGLAARHLRAGGRGPPRTGCPLGCPHHFALPRTRKKSLQISRADARTRTGDPFITSEVLYQLSYVGVRRDFLDCAPSGSDFGLRGGCKILVGRCSRQA